MKTLKDIAVAAIISLLVTGIVPMFLAGALIELLF